MVVPERSGSKGFKIKTPGFRRRCWDNYKLIRTLGYDDAIALVALRFGLSVRPLICRVAGGNELEERFQMTPVAGTNNALLQAREPFGGQTLMMIIVQNEWC